MPAELSKLNIEVLLPAAWGETVEAGAARQSLHYYVRRIQRLLPYGQLKIDLEEVRYRVQSYLETLLQSLQLPVQPEISLAVKAPDVPESELIEVRLHDRAIFPAPPSDPDEDKLVQALSVLLCRCRNLLVTDEVIRFLLNGWLGDSLAQLENPEIQATFRWLFNESVRYGLGTGHWRNSCGLLLENPSRRTAEALFEEELRKDNVASVRLYLSRTQYLRCFDANTGKPKELSGEEKNFTEQLEMMDDALFSELGLLVQMEKVEIRNDLVSPWFLMQWNEVPMPPLKGLQMDEFLVNQTVAGLLPLNLEGQRVINPALGNECALLRGGPELRRRCEQEANLSTWGPEGYLILHVGSQIRENAGAFMTSKLWEFYANQLREAFSVLVDEASRGFDSITLTRTLRCLLAEGISIRDLRTILEATLAVESTSTADFCKFIIFEPNTGFHFPARDSRAINDLDGEAFAECARMALRSYISDKYTHGSANLAVYLLDPNIEARLTRIEQEPLTQSEYEGMVAAIRQEVALQPSTGQTPTILTTIPVRRFLRRLIETDFPWLSVLSYQELSPNTNIQPLARISFDF